jgi:predicted amidophosphoribosyltransferase
MGLIDALLGRHRDRKCPRCGESISLELDECPKCHSKIKEMYVVVCPECKSEAPLKSERCPKCGKFFGKEKTIYICPMCGFRADFVMTACPACGQKFM